MFSSLAKLADRFRIPVIIFWIALAVSLLFFAPAISKVGVTDDTQFLPRDTQSTQADLILREKFATAVQDPPGSALIVINNEAGLSQQDLQEAHSFHDWLLSREAPSVITGVISVFDNEALRSTLVSSDQTTMLMNIDMSTASASAATRQAVADIRAHIQGQHPAARIYLTGSGGIFSDLLIAVQQTIDKTTLVTIILVIFLLLIIYRSPVAIFVPLLTIGVSYLVARGITGLMAASGFSVSGLVDAYLVVTLFGIGTDYCLFMVSRFKEEMAQGDRKLAGQLALRQIGPVILASATTLIVALLCLGISQFGLNRTTGYVMAIGVAITLIASLTLTPALISLFGRRLLWPAKFQPNRTGAGGLWHHIGLQITKRPALFIFPIIIILALPYLALPGIRSSADMLSQMPPDIESVRGFNVLRGHFSTGNLSPLAVLVESPEGSLINPSSQQSIGAIGESLKKVSGVSRVDYFSAPVNQLAALGQQVRSTGDELAAGNTSHVSFFQTLGQSLQSLAIQYPGVTQSSNFKQAAASLSQISAVLGQVLSGTAPNIPAALGQVRQLANSLGDSLQSLSGEFNLQGTTPLTQWLRTTYFSTDGTVAKINVFLATDPYSKDSIGAVSRVRDTTAEAISANLAGAGYDVGGLSASQADILAINDSDFIRVLALAIIGILLITMILLRSIVAPLYMIITVLLNFGATMGLATWVFLDVLHQSSMIYMLPIFVFVILVAVGSDYNIFLVSRIREESRRQPLREAICSSVSSTGGVITACGIILAGTFGTLMFASLQLVFQVGAAIAMGVIIDTFLVRAMLIPSLATVFGKWNWWPAHSEKSGPPPEISKSSG